MKKDYIVELREEEAEADKLINAHWVGELIRCKDCKHHGKDTCSAAGGLAYPPPDDWFCADGERREDDA